MIGHARAEEQRIAVMHVVGSFRGERFVILRARLAAEERLGAGKYAKHGDAARVDKHVSPEAALMTASRLNGVDRDDAGAFANRRDDTVFEEDCGVGFFLQQGERHEIAIRLACGELLQEGALCAARHQADFLAGIAAENRAVVDQRNTQAKASGGKSGRTS